MDYQINVQDKVVLVTGGSRGIGRGIADAFYAKGAKVAIADILVDVDQEQLFIVKTDVTDEVSVEEMVNQVINKFGRIDILVNNAGIMYKDLVENIDLAKWNRLIEINLTGTMLCTKKVVPYLKKQGWGRIINISSMMAVTSAETYSAYCAAKAGVFQLTKVWAAELASYGVTVNSICPGWVYTPMVVGFLERIAALHETDIEGALKKIFSLVPQKRLISPAEIAFIALFLASELAKGINGADIVVDTGLTAMMPLGIHAKSDELSLQMEAKRMAELLK
jgi:3-hydroxybutyrate dehydrogenase